MKILVADDDEITRRILGRDISSLDDEVVFAKNGNEAWDILNSPDPPQIAVLDWVMPGKTGVEICAECQKKGLTSYLILLTSKEGAEDMMYALDQGAHDFQSKPIVHGILKSRIKVAKRLIEATQEVMRSERLAAVGSLVTGVAHQFNNLNTPILMYASSILRDPDLDTGIREQVEKIEKAAQQAGAVTEKLMTIASNNVQEKKLKDLNQLVAESIKLESIYFKKQNIEVQADLGLIPKVFVDENEMHYVIMHLFRNASDAMIACPEKKIMVKTGVQGDRVYLNVSDTGCGIAANKLQSIFSPFYTEKGEFAEPNSSQVNIKGMGIGLYASRNIALDHGGEITVDSRIDKGSSFTLTLPIHEE